MTRISQSFASMSIPARIAFGALVLAGPAQAGAATAGSSPYYGRWTVSDERPVFTARGRFYKTIDVAPCGGDFCGVSVGDDHRCGPVLFRFLGRHTTAETLHGHGRWGAEQKNVVMYASTSDNTQGGPLLELYVGDGHDFGERSGNMPKFHAQYRQLGGAQCMAR